MLDKYLSAWLLFLAVHILCVSVSQNENIPYSSKFLYLCYILAGLHGSFLYLCTKSLTSNSSKEFKKEHFTIAGCILIVITGFFLYNLYQQETAIATRKFAFCFNALFIVLAIGLYLADTFGKENIVAAYLHRDEETPHIHVTLVPIVKGERKRKKREEQAEKRYRKKPTDTVRLCADDIITRLKLKSYQDTYAEAMPKYGLQSGINGSEAHHISPPVSIIVM